MNKYMSNKNMYLGLRSLDQIGGKGKGKRKSKIQRSEPGSIQKESLETEMDKKAQIDEIAKDDQKKLKKITLKDFRGLVLRLYERNGEKTVHPIIFRTPRITEYLDKIDPSVCTNGGCTIDLDSLKYMDYYDQEYGDITRNELKELIIDFESKGSKIKLAFYDNLKNGSKEYFEIQEPIRLVDLIEKIFDHFDDVDLPGYPDNGGIDWIKYDPKNDIYMIYTWS